MLSMTRLLTGLSAVALLAGAAVLLVAAVAVAVVGMRRRLR
ncbi:hypothetical protein [Brevundimonas sp.]|nr:hypothetical protein [Brevundimonas sp.]MDQ7813376.1 hypothetical protein [Brevundimonas sp.]